MKKLIIALILMLVGGQSVHAMEQNKSSSASIIEQSREYAEAQRQRYQRYLASHSASADDDENEAKEVQKALALSLETEKRDRESVPLSGRFVNSGRNNGSSAAGAMVSSSSSVDDDDNNEDKELREAIALSLETKKGYWESVPLLGRLFVNKGRNNGSSAAGAVVPSSSSSSSSAAADDESLALAMELQEKADEEFIKTLSSKELSTHEIEGSFTWTPYEYGPLDENATISLIEAKKQKGSTCGVHTVVNARAIDDCLADKISVFEAPKFHAELYRNTTSIATHMKNLSIQEVLELSKMLDLNNFYILTTIKRDNQYILVRPTSTPPLEDALKKLTSNKAIHFGLHLGNHWILLSIVNQNGKKFLTYMDSSVTDAVGPHAFHYIRFVNDRFMK
ncbi:MAG: hypothetical protein Q8Q25_02050 [bacterium]|nr:hypothetical protein [bacterium]